MTKLIRERPIFIVGVGRSGTSLLHSILASHPEIYFPPETGLLRRLFLSGRLRNGITRESLKELWEVLSTDARFSRLKISTGEELGHMLELNGDAISGPEAYARIMSFLAYPKPMFGDKDPRLVESLPQIHVAWPNAYIIHVIRDPRDIVASKKLAKWSRGRPLWHYLLANRVQYSVGRNDGTGLFNDHYIEVFYEELLLNEVSVLRRLCQSLGIEFVQEMLSFSEEAKRLVTDEERTWKKETLGPLLKSNFGKWRSQLSILEIASTETVCAAAIDDNAFCPQKFDKTSLPTLVRIYAAIYGSLIIMAASIYKLIRWIRLRSLGRIA